MLDPHEVGLLLLLLLLLLLFLLLLFLDLCWSEIKTTAAVARVPASLAFNFVVVL